MRGRYRIRGLSPATVGYLWFPRADYPWRARTTGLKVKTLPPLDIVGFAATVTGSLLTSMLLQRIDKRKWVS